MPFPTEALLAAPLVIFFGYTVFGITGFGASIATIPLLAHLFPLRFAVPLMLLYDLTAGLMVGLRNRGQVDRREMVRLVPFMLIGIGLGLTLLVKAPQSVLMLGLGAFVLIYAAWSLLGRHRSATLAPGWAVPLSTIGGIASATFGTGGVIYAIYLARRLPDKSVLRATAASVIVVSGVSRLAVFVLAGLYAQEGILLLALVYAPAMALGLWLGSKLHHRLPARKVLKLVWAILVVGGAGLVVRGLQ